MLEDFVEKNIDADRSSVYWPADIISYLHQLLSNFKILIKTRLQIPQKIIQITFRPSKFHLGL